MDVAELTVRTGGSVVLVDTNPDNPARRVVLSFLDSGDAAHRG